MLKLFFKELFGSAKFFSLSTAKTEKSEISVKNKALLSNFGESDEFMHHEPKTIEQLQLDVDFNDNLPVRRVNAN